MNPPLESYLAVQDLIDFVGGESPAKEIMEFVDVDGDGRLSFEENFEMPCMIMNDDSRNGENHHNYNHDNNHDITPPPTSHHHHHPLTNLLRLVLPKE